MLGPIHALDIVPGCRLVNKMIAETAQQAVRGREDSPNFWLHDALLDVTFTGSRVFSLVPMPLISLPGGRTYSRFPPIG
jgi:hypothetical protein